MSIFSKNNPKIAEGRITPEILHSLGRILSFSLSRDCQTIVYEVEYSNIKENKTGTQFYTMNIDGTNNRRITDTDAAKSTPQYLNNGKIIFLQQDQETGQMQLFQMESDGTNSERLTKFSGGVSEYLLSPDNKKIIYISQVKNIPPVQDKYPELDKATGLIATDVMYLHWDQWMSTIPHPFLASFDGKKIDSSLDLLEGTKYECPMVPFNSISDLCWSPDSNHIAYIMKASTGLEYAFHTRMNLYLYDTRNCVTKNVTEGYKEKHGFLNDPSFSPDGKKIAFGMMSRDGFESDLKELYVYDIEENRFEKVKNSFRESVICIKWKNDCRSIFFAGNWHAHMGIYELNLESGEAVKLTSDKYDYWNFEYINGCLYTIQSSKVTPHDIVSIDINKNCQIHQLTYENKHIFDSIKTTKYEERWIESKGDGKKFHTYVFYPPDFDPKKKYPCLLYCQGGPQEAVENTWQYQWNFMVIASQGYIVVGPNRRGVPGFGIEWIEEVSMNFGGNCIADLLSAIDNVSKEPFVDENRLGCIGPSFGGFSVFYLMSHHEKRFKVFVAHDGLFDFRQGFLDTEETWWFKHDVGAPWDVDKDPVVKKSYQYSPSNFIEKWDTPILVIHGAKDYRLLASHGIQAFNAARMRGIEAKLLIFPDEGHWVQKPQNAILWEKTIYDWLDQHLK